MLQTRTQVHRAHALEEQHASAERAHSVTAPLPALVLGIGNTLLGDEGVGVHVVAALQRDHAALPAVRYLDGGTLGFTLAADVAAADHLVVVDAARLDAPPGTVRSFADAEMDRFLAGRRRTPHEVGLLDLLDMARLSGDLPARRALVAIQPERLDWGVDPTPAVREAVPAACDAVLDLLRRWRQ